MQKVVGIAQQSRRYGFALAISALMTMGIAVGLAGAEGVDTTTLDLDRYGADVVPTADAYPAIIDADGGPDITTLYLDRHGADLPTADWWDRSDYASAADARQGPDITKLNLDRYGADVAGQ